MLESLKNKKILLIEPPFYILFGYKRYRYPLTLTLVGTYLEKQGNSVNILDCDLPNDNCKEYNRNEARLNYPRYEEELRNKNNPIWEKIKKTLLSEKPDVVGLSSVTAKIDSTNYVAKLVKETLGRNVTVILGGPHVTGMLKTDKNHNFGENYDFVVPFIPNLVTLKPNKSLLIDVNSYTPEEISTIMTSSGCPNKCTFCCHSYDRTFPFRDEKNLLEELNETKNKFGSGLFVYIIDDCLFSFSKHFYNVTNALKKTGMIYSAEARLKALSKEKLQHFIDTGGKKLFVGVESGSQRVLDRINKNITINEIIERTKWINDLNIHWSAFFIIGFPFETIEDLKKTKELILKIQPTFASLNQFTPYPGTELYNEFFSDKKLEFKDLFQLSGKRLYGGFNKEELDYMEEMFDFVDKYNESKKKELLSKK